MKEVVVFYKGKEVIRIKCEKLFLMGNGFKLETNGIEVARFLNDYDYTLSEFIKLKENYIFEIKQSDNDSVINNIPRRNI